MRLRFSTRRLLVFVSFWCIALGVWRTCIYEPPTHKISLYEKAYGTRRLSKRIGPNTIRIARVARNRCDGSLTVEDGHRASLSAAKVTNPKHLAQAAPWLDVVQIELEPGPELLDILEVRIFDHKTRTLISHIHPRFGWQVLQPNLLQIYGLGKELPAKVDVWLRAHSYDAKDVVTRLEPTIGASCTLPGGTFTLQDVRAGTWDYDSSKGGYHTEHGNSPRTSTVVVWQGNGPTRNYQISAVSHNQAIAHSDGMHFLRPEIMDSVGQPLTFQMPLKEISHFELRPFGGRHRFFFEAVQLPPATGKAFSKPPVAMLKLDGQESNVDIPEYAPLFSRFATYRGNWTQGSSYAMFSSTPWVLQRPGGAIAVEDEFTIVYHLRGIHDVSWQFRFQDSIVNKLRTESEMSIHSSGVSGQVGHKNFRRPLNEIKAVEITLQPGP